MHDIGFLCTSIMSFKIDQKVTIDNQIQRVRKRGGGGGGGREGSKTM